MSQDKVVRFLWLLVTAGIAVYYVFYTSVNADTQLSVVVSALGFVLIFVASLFVVLVSFRKPLAQFIRQSWLAYLPASLVPIIGAWDVEFPGSGLMSLIWPILMGAFFVFNPPFIAWCQNLESGRARI